MKKIMSILLILSTFFVVHAEQITAIETNKLQIKVLTAKPTVNPPAGSKYIYPKDDGYWYALDSAGVETCIQNPTAHASRHTDGTDDIQSATNAQKGLATAAHITAIEANTAKITESTTVSAPLVLTTYGISLPVATTSADGYLSSIDWNTFNNKQPALGYTAEDSANKATTFGVVNDTLYPTVQAVVNYISGSGYGDMLKSVYDAANIAEQLVGLTAAQTLTNKTLTTPIFSDSATKGAYRLTARSSEPSAPSAGDIYLDDGTNTSSGLTGLRHYTGSAWEDISGAGGGGNEVSGTFTTSSPNFSAGILTITHTYGTWYPPCFSIYDNNGKLIPFADELTVTNNTITVDLSSFTVTGAWYYTGGDAVSSGGGSSGDVVGPSSATDSAVALFDGTTGKLLKDGYAVGTSANNLVQLDGSAKLPAVDGSQLTNLPGASSDTVATVTASGNWTVPAGVTLIKHIYIIAGGGGGASGYNGPAGGGGGGGGIKHLTDIPVTPSSNLACVIGAGGPGSTTAQTGGSKGGDSSITINSITHTAEGGGPGGAYSSVNGDLDGGCGGGAAYGSATRAGTGIAATLGQITVIEGQGYDGGGVNTGVGAASGGGGYGSIGTTCTHGQADGAPGGIGINLARWGLGQYGGGGGGGAGYTGDLTGGTASYGGGNGGNGGNTPTDGSNASNYGGGGGGGGANATATVYNGGNGYQGVIFIIY